MFNKGVSCGDMFGGIIGDIIGSIHEFSPIKTKVFDLFVKGSNFTDDTVLTIATADAILNKKEYASVYREYAKRYPNRGYGTMFRKWVNNDGIGAYNSFGNGSAMRVGPIGWAFDDLETVLAEAKKSAEVTHNHEEGIKGAQAVATAIYLARTGSNRDKIKNYIESRFGYDLSMDMERMVCVATFDETCMVSVPQAISCFLQSNSFEDAIRNAISLGADSDTQACIAGSIAEAFYKEIPKEFIANATQILDKDLNRVAQTFAQRYVVR
jgi:ADP-ribosylglycohydrolase